MSRLVHRPRTRVGASARRFGPARLLLATWVLAATITGTRAGADVFLNELTVRPVGASDLVELHNRGAGPVDVSGWTISADKGTFVLPPGSIIGPGLYPVFDVGDIMLERGGVTSLIDILQGVDGLRSTVRDAVSYGQAGSAPLPPAGMSLARAPDASAGVPPPPNSASDGLVWTIDPTPTFGDLNDAPGPQLGGGVVLNEVDPALIGSGDALELFNPSPVPVPVFGWTLVNGDAAMPLNGIVPAVGFLAIPAPPGFDLEEEELVYLFNEAYVRVDQLGFHLAPPLQTGESLQRCPDGAPPYLGYDYVTSGSDVTFRVLPRSLGFANCSAQSVPAPEPRRLGWGRLKTEYHSGTGRR